MYTINREKYIKVANQSVSRWNGRYSIDVIHHGEVIPRSRVTFRYTYQNRHPIARPWCQYIGYRFWVQGPYAIWDISPKIIFNPSIAKFRFPITNYQSAESLRNYAQNTTVILPYFVQNAITIGQLKLISWRNEISRDFSLRWVGHALLYYLLCYSHITTAQI